MQRVLILGSIVLAVAGMGVTRLSGIEERLADLDRLRRELPANARAVQADLAQLEQELASLATRVENARGNRSADREALDDADRRLEEITARLQASQAVIEANAAELLAMQTGVDARYDGLTRAVDAAQALASNAADEVVRLNEGLNGSNEPLCWREMVGPTVQLAGDTTVGSGVLLRSRPDPDQPERWETLLITSWHVVRDIRADALQEDPPIPVAVYLESGEIRHEAASLLAHDVEIDVALLRMNTDELLPWGATLPTREELGRMAIFRDIYAVGCPLGNDPIPTRGEIADLDHRVDGKDYWMISAPTYIGNSGGGIFDADSHALLGIFSKIYTHGSLRQTVVPHMGLVTPIPQIYDWLESNGHAELVPSERGVALVVAGPLRR